MKATITGNERSTIVSLTNLSRQAFFGFQLEVQGAGIVPCKEPLHNKPPAWPWKKAPEVGTSGVKFQIAQFHPGWEISICTLSTQDVGTTFFLRETGSEGENTQQAIRLVEPSLETFFVRHELFLLIILIVVASVVAVLWLFLSEPVE